VRAECERVLVSARECERVSEFQQVRESASQQVEERERASAKELWRVQASAIECERVIASLSTARGCIRQYNCNYHIFLFFFSKMFSSCYSVRVAVA